MTDTKLGVFDDVPVYKAAIEVRNLAGGLRDAMKIEPTVMRSGDRVFFICEAVVGDIDHDRIDKEDLSKGWTRVHVLSAEAATFVDEQLVSEALDKHKALLALAKDDETGQQRLGHEQDLLLEHQAGRHKRLRKGCPECDRERELAALEKEEAKAAKKNGDGTVTPLAGRRKK